MPNVWTFTRALHARAEREGWGIFNDAQVQRIDDRDTGEDPLPDDNAAMALARAAGVPVDDDGYLTCDELKYE
jgi:hypothetical protein